MKPANAVDRNYRVLAGVLAALVVLAVLDFGSLSLEVRSVARGLASASRSRVVSMRPMRYQPFSVAYVVTIAPQAQGGEDAELVLGVERSGLLGFKITSTGGRAKD